MISEKVESNLVINVTVDSNIIFPKSFNNIKSTISQQSNAHFKSKLAIQVRPIFKFK